MNNYLPVMLLKDLITLPNQEVKVELSNNLSKKLLTLAFKHHNGDLLIVCPKDALEESPDINDLPLVGVVGHIKSKIVLPNGNIRVTLVGINRVNIFEYRNFDDDKEIYKALRKANFVGAMATLKKGAVGVVPSKEKIDKFEI